MRFGRRGMSRTTNTKILPEKCGSSLLTQDATPTSQEADSCRIKPNVTVDGLLEHKTAVERDTKMIHFFDPCRVMKVEYQAMMI